MILNIDIHLEQYKKYFLSECYTLDSFLHGVKELDFLYLIEASSVYSSNIEGNSLNLNSFMNAKMQQKKGKEIQEIENLASAYVYAQENDEQQEFWKNGCLLRSLERNSGNSRAKSIIGRIDKHTILTLILE